MVEDRRVAALPRGERLHVVRSPGPGGSPRPRAPRRSSFRGPSGRRARARRSAARSRRWRSRTDSRNPGPRSGDGAGGDGAGTPSGTAARSMRPGTGSRGSNAHPVRDHAAAVVRRLEGPLVLPGAHAQHGRALEEGARRVQAHERQVVPVDRRRARTGVSSSGPRACRSAWSPDPAGSRRVGASSGRSASALRSPPPGSSPGSTRRRAGGDAGSDAELPLAHRAESGFAGILVTPKYASIEAMRKLWEHRLSRRRLLGGAAAVTAAPVLHELIPHQGLHGGSPSAAAAVAHHSGLAPRLRSPRRGRPRRSAR